MTPAVVHLLGLLLSAPLVLAAPPAELFAGLETPTSATPTAAPEPSPPMPLIPRPQVTSTTGVWPLDPKPSVARGFDPPATRYAAGHRGVDLVGSPGQTVRVAQGGRVTFAGRLAGRGVVVVTHGATRSTYEPVLADVRVGTLVQTGEELGVLEAFGSHCAPSSCLHWGLIEGDTYLDPLSLLGAGPVRLLPLLGVRP